MDESFERLCKMVSKEVADSFRAGQSAEREKAKGLVGALEEISRPHKIGGSSLEEWLRCHTAAKNALAAFNASPGDSK